MLEKGWAEYFLHNIFAKIIEELFSTPYRENFSRPNAPVNILVGLLILKELNRFTGEELIVVLCFDYRVRYALGISAFGKERICINTIGNFRKRLYQDTSENDRDLLKEELASLTKNLIKLSGMDISLARQDSMVISANAKKMGRMELIYSVDQAALKLLDQSKTVPEELASYLYKKDKADQIYRLKKEEVEERTALLLKESFLLYDFFPEELIAKEAFKHLACLIEVQTDHLSPKKPKVIKAGSMQNPNEPEATCRVKGKKSSVGYIANFVEARDKEKGLSMIIPIKSSPTS